MKKGLKYLFICVINTLFIVGNAQNKAVSIETILADKSTHPAQKIKLLNQKSHEILEQDAQKAQQFAKQAVLLAQNEKEKPLLAESYISLSSALYNRNMTDSAEIIIQKAVETGVKEDNISAEIFQILGDINADKGKYETALSNYYKALKIFEKKKKDAETAHLLSNLGSVYYNLGENDKMFEYYNKSLIIHRKIKSQVGIASNQANLGNYYFSKNDTSNTIKALSEARNVFHQLKYYPKEANVLGDIGDFYSVFYQNYDKSIAIYKDALNLLKEGENNNIRMDTYRKISLASYHKTDYANAVDFMKKAIAITDTANGNIVRMNHLLLTYDYIGLRGVDKATEALDKYVEITDAVYGKNLKKNIAEMETKYQTEKKEIKIQSLEKQRKLYWIISIVVFVSLLAFVLSLYFRHKNIKTKKELAEQKVIQLEQEKQLVATQAILDGETAERTRLARDLHDGLGGMLSAVKLNLFDMKKDVVLETDDVTRFNKVLEMLDNSIQELRRIAHNMMPESLSRYGLKIALEDFCNSFSNVKFHFFGTEQRLEKTLETTIYRAVHELVNNAVKHSQAETINVQLIQQTEAISINVQDDGLGFNIDKDFKGRGLQNIQNRINSVGGTMNIFSTLNKGTEISIDINIPQENGKN